MDRNVSTALGEAMTSSFLQAAILVRLVAKGVLTKEEAIFLVDTTLLSLERRRIDLDEGGIAAVDHARSRLESLIAQLQSIQEGSA
jgi:hypothetical protein